MGVSVVDDGLHLCEVHPTDLPGRQLVGAFQLHLGTARRPIPELRGTPGVSS